MRRYLIAKRAVDLVLCLALLPCVLPVVALCALAIKIESRGPVFFGCRRVGFRGRELRMLKFRKMRDGASGAPLTVNGDARFTRVERLLAKTKLDEIPQLWNVLKGEMSLVGPRPEDPAFVDPRRVEYSPILAVKPGMTGLTQLAFAKEGEIVDVEDRVGDYVARLLPQKMALDTLYAGTRSVRMDLRIIAWTAFAVLLRGDVAVHRHTGRLSVRRWPARARSVTVEHPRPALGSPGQERLLDRIVVIGCRRLEHVFRADRRHSNIRHLLKRGGDQVKLRKRSGRGRGMRTAVVLGERSRVGNASCGEALVAGVMRASATLQRFIRPARKRRACRIAARDAERRSAVTYSTQ